MFALTVTNYLFTENSVRTFYAHIHLAVNIYVSLEYCVDIAANLRRQCIDNNVNQRKESMRKKT